LVGSAEKTRRGFQPFQIDLILASLLRTPSIRLTDPGCPIVSHAAVQSLLVLLLSRSSVVKGALRRLPFALQKKESSAGFPTLLQQLTENQQIKNRTKCPR
jgi:hypothetical protein